jgi:uncharacterized membrane protein
MSWTYQDDCQKYADQKCANITISNQENPADISPDALGTYSGTYSGYTYTSKEECLRIQKSRCEQTNKSYKEEQNKFKQDRLKSMFKLSGIVVGVPLAFVAYSKYKKYDTKKTAKVAVIGSVLVLSAIWVNVFSGAWGGETISQRFLRNLGLKEKQKKN